MLFRMTKRLRDWLEVADMKPLLYNEVQIDSNREWYGNALSASIQAQRSR